MPDLNVSFTSSKLNIRSGNGTMKTSICSSPATIISSKSSHDVRVQPSLTEITATKKISESERFLEAIECEEQSSKLDSASSLRENNFCSSLKSLELRHHMDDADFSIISEYLDLDLLTSSNVEVVNGNLHRGILRLVKCCPDLIDLRASDSVSTFRECDPIMVDRNESLSKDCTPILVPSNPFGYHESVDEGMSAKQFTTSNSELSGKTCSYCLFSLYFGIKLCFQRRLN